MLNSLVIHEQNATFVYLPAHQPDKASTVELSDRACQSLIQGQGTTGDAMNPIAGLKKLKSNF